MDIEILWAVRDWADVVARTPAAGLLPRRTVLVPHERAAHTLRRELLRAGHGVALTGTRFVPTAVAAAEVLLAANVDVTPDEDRLRRVRLATMFRSSIPLKHFPPDLVRDRPGWDDAFADTIGELEGAGLRPEDLATPPSSDRLSDLAMLWRLLDSSAGTSWTRARIMLEAARVLERVPAAWPFAGTTCAFAGVGVTAVEARFVRAIPHLTLGLAAARPVRDSYVVRVRAIFGDAARDAVTSASAPKTAGSERNLLASFFFEAPPVLASPTRPRSDGPDSTVEIEEHAGVDDEVDAAAVWVARQIAAGTPLEEIAILAPALDPYVSLLSDRLARLPWLEGGRLPVYVEGGLPLTSSAAGARARAVVWALSAHLSAAALADVLPVLAVSGEARHLSRGAAMDLAWSLGTVGGNAAHPAGALEWAARAEVREADLVVALEAARADDDAGRLAKDLERRLADLRAVRPALDALVALSRLVVEDAPLETIWPVVREFLTGWVRQPGAGPDVATRLDDAMVPIASDTVCRTLSGRDALAVIERAIVSARLDSGRFGDPAVYVGTVAGAVGLAFTAVRVVGLSEGHLPSAMRDDPVLPDEARAELAASSPGGVLVTAHDRALDELHALDVVVRNASAHVALSTARLDVTRSEREPSSVILEAAAAISRPHRATGARDSTIPTRTAIGRDFFVPARDADAAFRREYPLGEAAWQDGVSRREFSPPPEWRALPAVDPDRIERLMRRGEAGALDGVLGSDALIVNVPGLTTARPISPSRLEPLLNCPHAFLLHEVLGFETPAEPPPQREIGQPFYGSLFHGVVAECYRSFGSSLATGEGALETWFDRADLIVNREFENFLREYPLAGAAVRRQQLERLRRDVHDLLRYDWALAAPERRFIAVERPFGQDTPVALPLSKSGRALFVRGRIDRIDTDGQTTLVRDLKTGRPHGRIGKEEDPTAAIDLQIAVYALVARAHAADWQIPSRIGAAYVYLSRGRSDERSYRQDFHLVLEPAAQSWLDLAGDLLEARVFPRTPVGKECDYCAFKPVCGDRANEGAASLLDAAVRGTSALDADTTRVLRAFAESKGVAEPEGEDA